MGYGNLQWEKGSVPSQLHQAGLDGHQAGLDGHPAGLDRHQAGLELHQAGLDGHVILSQLCFRSKVADSVANWLMSKLQASLFHCKLAYFTASWLIS